MKLVGQKILKLNLKIIKGFFIIVYGLQITSNCSALQTELTSTQAQIINVQKNITTNTNNLIILNQKLVTYEIKVNTTTGSTKILNQNMATIYKNLVISTTETIAKFNTQLTTLQTKEAQLISSIEVSCLNTVSPLSDTPVVLTLLSPSVIIENSPTTTLIPSTTSSSTIYEETEPEAFTDPCGLLFYVLIF